MSQAIDRPPQRRRLTAAWIGGFVIIVMFAACLGTLGWTTDYYDEQYLNMVHMPPSLGAVEAALVEKLPEEDRPSRFHNLFGTDALGRSLFARCLLGGAISLGIGLAAAAITMFIGTAWGMIAGYAGGRTDAVMMRIVDVLYGLPYILLVILLAVASGGMIDAYRAEQRAIQEQIEASRQQVMAEAEAASGEEAARLREQAERFEYHEPWLLRQINTYPGVINLITLLIAIGAVSWLTLARVVRGQVLSLKAQPFVEAARATGCSPPRILLYHMLPNLIGPIIVYTTLTVPQAILQESFLSFLGIGVQAPMPSWGNLAADGLPELNPVKMHGWLLAWPCLLLGLTLLALNFMGDGLRDRFDPKSTRT